MSSLLEAAQRAYEETRIYRRLYPARPDCVSDVPFISYVHFHQVRKLLDFVASPSAVLGAVPAFHRKARPLPLTPFESEDEWHGRLRRLLAALSHLGLPVRRQKLSFLIVADDSTGPFACEVNSLLGWERHHASIVYVDGRGDDWRSDLELFDPDAVLLVSAQVGSRPGFADGRRTITFTHHQSRMARDSAVDRVLVTDELHAIGARLARAGEYMVFDPGLCVEREPSSGVPAVTTLDFDCLPLIRFKLGQSLELKVSPAGFDV